MSRSLKSFPELPLKLLAIGTIAETNVSLQDAVEVLREQAGRREVNSANNSRAFQTAAARTLGFEVGCRCSIRPTLAGHSHKARC